MSEQTDFIIAAPLWPHGAPALLHLVRRAAQRSTAEWAATVTSGLTAVQYAVLVVLAEEDGCDQQSVGSRAGFDKATGTYLIDRMSQSGLIQAQVDPANRRRKLVSLTPLGRETLQAMVEQAKAAEAQFAARLTPDEVSALKRLLGKLAGVELQPVQEDVAGRPQPEERSGPH